MHSVKVMIILGKNYYLIIYHFLEKNCTMANKIKWLND